MRAFASNARQKPSPRFPTPTSWRSSTSAFVDGFTYAVAELLDGETLRSRLARARMSWRQAAEIAASIADGLAAVHAKGIIHRDLKPENIVLTPTGT